MIEAKELRIGNLVKDGNDYIPVCKDAMIALLDGIVEVDPIPLTEEWLERFGFNKRANEYSIDGWCFELFYNELHYSGGEGVKLSEHIKYVHQLQNLYFPLTGEELELRED